MAMTANYKDDVLDTTYNTRRHYRVINHADGTITLEDATVYSQQGTRFGAEDVNEIIENLNGVGKKTINIKTVTLTYLNESELRAYVSFDGEHEAKGCVATPVRNTNTINVLKTKCVTITADQNITSDGTFIVSAFAPNGDFARDDEITVSILF